MVNNTKGHSFPPSKRTKRYVGQQTIGAVVSKVTDPMLKKRGIVSNRLILDWPAIVGQSLAKHSLPKRIIYSKGEEQKGTLVIDVYHSGLATELEYMKDVIKEKIAVFYGFQAISQVKICLTPKPVKNDDSPIPFYQPEAVCPSQGAEEVEALLENITDEHLKDTLRKLGQHIAAEKAE